MAQQKKFAINFKAHSCAIANFSNHFYVCGSEPSLVLKFSMEEPSPLKQIKVVDFPFKIVASKSDDSIFVCFHDSVILSKFDCELKALNTFNDLNDLREVELVDERQLIIVKTNDMLLALSSKTLEVINSVEIQSDWMALCLDNDNSCLYTCSKSGELLMVDFELHSLSSVTKFDKEAEIIRVSAKERTLALLFESFISIFDLHEKKVRHNIAIASANVNQLLFIPKSNHFVVCNQSGELDVFDAGAFSQIAVKQVHNSSIFDFDIKQNVIVTASLDSFCLMIPLNDVVKLSKEDFVDEEEERLKVENQVLFRDIETLESTLKALESELEGESNDLRIEEIEKLNSENERLQDENVQLNLQLGQLTEKRFLLEKLQNFDKGRESQVKDRSRCVCSKNPYPRLAFTQKWFGTIKTILSDGSFYTGKFFGKGTVLKNDYMLSSFFDLGQRISENVKIKFIKRKLTVIGRASVFSKSPDKDLIPFKIKTGNIVIVCDSVFSFQNGLFSGWGRIYFKKDCFVKGKIVDNRVVMDTSILPMLHDKNNSYKVEGVGDKAFMCQDGVSYKFD